MKKLNAKFIATAVIASMVASAAAVSASAADYGFTPGYPDVDTSAITGSGSTSGGSTTTTTPADTTNTDDEKDDTESTGAAVVSESAVESAIASGEDVDVAVDDNGNAVVQEAAIGAIAAGDEAVTFDVSDPDSDTDYQIVIDPDLIDEVKDINLAMTISIPDADDDVDGVEVPAGSIVIAPAQKGNFGMTLEIVIPAAALADIDVDAAQVYYIADDGSVELVEGGLVKNADGSVSVFLSHASAYVISDVDLVAAAEEETGLEGDDDDDGNVTIEDPSDAGKDDTSVVVNGNGSDTNPVTGTTLALGSLAVFAAAAVATSKKRK